MTEKDFCIILEKLDKIISDIEKLNHRVNNLEEKTNDLHHYVPFVGWLEEVGQNISQRFNWLTNYRAPPFLIDINSDDSENDS
jgi:hypothetical protein